MPPFHSGPISVSRMLAVRPDYAPDFIDHVGEAFVLRTQGGDVPRAGDRGDEGFRVPEIGQDGAQLAAGGRLGTGATCRRSPGRRRRASWPMCSSASRSPGWVKCWRKVKRNAGWSSQGNSGGVAVESETSSGMGLPVLGSGSADVFAHPVEPFACQGGTSLPLQGGTERNSGGDARVKGGRFQNRTLPSFQGRGACRAA